MKTKLFKLLIWTGAFMVFVVLSTLLLNIQTPNKPIDLLITQELQNSGVSHNVTAILLNFRALDTLLEVGVILLALVAIYAITPHYRYTPLSFESTITNIFVSILFPLIVLSAFYIFYSGSYQSGGAFGAAALLAGGFIILRLVKPLYFNNIKETKLRLIYASGLSFFTFVGVITLFDGSFLEYRKTQATFFIVSIEFILSISLAAILAGFFINGVQRFRR